MPRGGVDDIPETYRLSQLEIKLLDLLQRLTRSRERDRLAVRATNEELEELRQIIRNKHNYRHSL